MAKPIPQRIFGFGDDDSDYDDSILDMYGDNDELDKQLKEDLKNAPRVSEEVEQRNKAIYDRMNARKEEMKKEELKKEVEKKKSEKNKGSFFQRVHKEDLSVSQIQIYYQCSVERESCHTG